VPSIGIIENIKKMTTQLNKKSNVWQKWRPVYKYTWARWQQSSYRHFAKHVGHNKVVLDIGTGTGAYIKMLPINNTYIFTDIDAASLKVAEEQAKIHLKPNTYQFVCCDAECAIKQFAYVDVIALLHVITVIPAPEKLLKQITDIMKPHMQVFIYVSGFSKKMPRALNKFVKFLGFNVIKVGGLHENLNAEKVSFFNERYYLKIKKPIGGGVFGKSPSAVLLDKKQN
jgi:ubiquinone/menaquinone biosynthesis C-methylase UbiE